MDILGTERGIYMRTVNQDTLRELEAMCTQEQPPAVMAACPLHVACREICGAISCGDFDAAYSLYSKSVPFPGIVSRLCTQPCAKSCVRDRLGGALSMQKLEESACIYGQVSKRRVFLPRRTDRVAVIGGGLYGLTIALELAKKGCNITLFEKREKLGGVLRFRQVLEEDVWHQELEILKDYPIEIQTGTEILDGAELKGTYSAVLKAYGRSFGSVVEEVYAGRQETITTDRRLKQVSLDAGREQEGSFKTTLYVETEGIEPRLPVCTDGRPYTKEEAMEEAQRCLDCKCLECVKGCAFLQHFKTFPRKYVREVYNNLSIAMGTRHANKMINACSVCGQCKAICPNGIDVGGVIKDARQIMVETGKMPASAFAFALDDLEQSNSQECILTRHQPGYSQSSYVFFPGCQLGASVPEVVVKAYEDLTKKLFGGVGIMLGCCGITADWAGQEQLFTETGERLKRRWEKLGSPKMIVACPTCYSTMEKLLGPEHCTGVWDIENDAFTKDGHREGRTMPEGSLVIKDACGAREYPHIHERMRTLLGKMGYQVSEDRYGREKSACCGFGGLVPYSSPLVANEAARLAVPNKDWNYVTYCMNCRDRYTKEGARAVHFLELLYDEDRGKNHKVPGWSSRQDNRIRLKQILQKQVWMETIEEKVQYSLQYSKETAELLEKRMILESDIRQVIAAAEETKEKLFHKPSTCYVAKRQLKHVTFWVWYKPLEEGFYIEKAYSHRMYIKEEQ